MKVLCLMGYFELPDDFEGNFSDALREFADYHENIGLKNKNRAIVEDELTEEELEIKEKFNNIIFKRFMQDRKKGNKVSMGVSMQKLIKGKWEKMDFLGFNEK